MLGGCGGGGGGVVDIAKGEFLWVAGRSGKNEDKDADEDEDE